MYESLQARIVELEKSNEALKSQLLEKEKMCMQLRKLIKDNTVGSHEVRSMKLIIPGEKDNTANTALDHLALMSSDMNFEIEYLKVIDELKLKSIALEESRKILESERALRVLAIKRASEGALGKDIQIQNLQSALEKACKRTCELEDRIAKSKPRLISNVGSSPILATATPRLSTGSIYSDNVQRTSLQGTIPTISSQRVPVNTTCAILPKIPFPTFSPQGPFSHVSYPYGGQ